ncbi:putative mfs multidrug protein [Lasiodiplodia theobromae]|nr:putative mfs multidrug protein [Lasiodiplodia theobromae]
MAASPANPWETAQPGPEERESFESVIPMDRRSMDEKDPEKDDISPSHIRSPPTQRGPYESDSTDDDIERQEQDRGVQKEGANQEARDPNLVVWNGPEDPDNPMNWPQWYKWLITGTLGMMTFCITFASSVFSTATMVTAQVFNVSTEVMTLGTSLFVLGFAFGPIMWGPFSELYGRKYPLFFGFFVFAIFQIPVAVAQNLQTIMICRFFGGFFGSGGKYILRPFAMIVLEPILLLITLYMAVVYGILYLFFESYPIAFQETRGWNEGVGALPFLSITVGVVIGGAVIAFTTKTRFKRKMEKHGKVIPEERLIPMIIGGFLFPAGMFWFAWTSSPNINPWPQIVAGVPIGAGILMIFLQGLNYIIDVYMMNANSAIAANTFLRSFAGAGFPLFAVALYHTLGVDWATSLLAFIAVALFPVPILFYMYGARIRKLSRYSPSA